MMDARLCPMQFVAAVSNGEGTLFHAYRSGDPQFYIFVPVRNGAESTLQIPVAKARLRGEVRRALARGQGNAI